MTMTATAKMWKTRGKGWIIPTVIGFICTLLVWGVWSGITHIGANVPIDEVIEVSASNTCVRDVMLEMNSRIRRIEFGNLKTKCKNFDHLGDQQIRLNQLKGGNK